MWEVGQRHLADQARADRVGRLAVFVVSRIPRPSLVFILVKSK